MELKEYKVKIIARSTEDFNFIENKLKSLPKLIYNQIEFAENLYFDFGFISCKFNVKMDDENNIYLPDSISEIRCNGDIICKGFIFKIPTEMLEYKINYFLIPCLL